MTALYGYCFQNTTHMHKRGSIDTFSWQTNHNVKAAVHWQDWKELPQTESAEHILKSEVKHFDYPRWLSAMVPKHVPGAPTILHIFNDSLLNQTHLIQVIVSLVESRIPAVSVSDKEDMQKVFGLQKCVSEPL